jgi:hypothetical protein
MRFTVRALVLVFAGVSFGCESAVPPVNAPTAVAPHHGKIIALPENQGFVELTNEPEVSDRRNPQPTSIVAYFLQSDGKSPMSPAPTDVSLAINEGVGKDGRAKPGSTQTVPLSAEPRSDDSAGAGRFASTPGPYDLEGIRGTLSAKIGGQLVSIPFAGGR